MSRAPAFLLAPIVLAQGRLLQRSTPRMAPATPRSGGSRSPDALRLLVVGDSTAVGTGVEQMPDAMAGQLARRLPESVAWRVVGENGATAAEVRERHLPEAVSAPADVVVVLVGWNDALRMRSAAAYAADLAALLASLGGRNREARLVVVGPPAFGDFAVLPQPLRFALGAHARGLARAAARVARAGGASFVPGFDGRSVASDRFHPDADGYAALAERVAAAVRR
jgi:lysophospholipase L1-like esterase